MAQADENPPILPDSISTALSQTQPRFEGATLQGHPAEEPSEENLPETPPPPPPVPPVEPPRYKYDSLDAYEHAYTEAERRIHTATEETRLAREEVERTKARLTALEATPPTPPTPPRPAGPPIAQGAREITLLGQNVNAWHGEGIDGRGWNLARLLLELAGIDGLARLRYTTSHPRDMDDDLKRER